MQESKFEVVISGISGRFPECDDILTFKSKLFEGENLVTVNNRKWPTDYKYYDGQTITEVPSASGKYVLDYAVDSRVFMMNNKFIRSTPPPIRKILEPAFEAIVDAGINPYSLNGRNIGVYSTYGFFETDLNLYDSGADSKSLLMIVGGARTMQANRISYMLNLTGPSFAFGADILGDINALKVAYDSVSNGFIEAAVVMVSSSLHYAEFSLQYIGLNILSPDGVNKVFDNAANGITRSEGSVAFYLQRSEDAKRNYGTITVCETYYPAMYSSSLLGCNKTALKEFLQTIYVKEELREVPFMELTSWGAKLQDKLQIEAIAETVCKKRKFPLLIGSIVSNIGYTEASSPYMGLAKAALCLDEGAISPNINYSQTDNQTEAIKRKIVQVVDRVTKLQGNQVAFNVIGLTGSVGHVILKENSNKPKCSEDIHSFPKLLLICGRSMESLQKVVTRIESMTYNEEMIYLANEAFIPLMPLHLYRGYTILPTNTNSTHEIMERGNSKKPIWFIFSGMGSHWNGMGKGLLDLPVFAHTIEKCSEILKSKGIDLYHLLTSDDPEIFNDITNSFVSIISVQIALVEVLRVLEIQPDGIIGHSAGECACAYADGCLTLEQAVLSAYARGRASVEAKTIPGLMAAIGKGFNYMKTRLPPNIEIACHNSDSSCTISGPHHDVLQFVSEIRNKGIFAKVVNVSNIAFHSKHIAPAAPLLLSALKTVITEPKKRSSKWISTSVPKKDWLQESAQYCSAEYFTNNLLNNVIFEEGLKHIPKEATLIEIAPHGLLQAILKRAFPEECTIHIPLTQRSVTKNNLNFLYSAIGRLYIQGYEPKVNALYPKIEYPVPKGTPSTSSLCTWNREDLDINQFMIPKKPFSRIPIRIQVHDGCEFSHLINHKIEGHIIAPLALYLFVVWRAFSFVRNEQLGSSSIIFEKIKLHKNLKLSIKKVKFVSVLVQGSGAFELILNKDNDKFSVLMTGIIYVPYDEHSIKIPKQETRIQDQQIVWDHSEIYHIFKEVGYELKDDFKLIQSAKFNASNEEYWGEIRWTGNWITFLDALLKFQNLPKVKKDSVCYYPTKIRYLAISKELQLSLKINQVVECHSDVTTKVTLCNGLTIRDVELKVFSSLRKTDYDSFKKSEISQTRLPEFGVQLQNDSISVRFHRIHKDINTGQLCVEYTGTGSSGLQIMGLALINGNTLETDSELTWTIPKKWNLLNALTLPLAYTQAYYLLHIYHNHTGSTILFINMGKEIYFAHACASLFTFQGYTVFISVANEEERVWMRKQFPKTERVKLIDQEDYESQILFATQNIGVSLVINCVQGEKHIIACTNCLSCYSLYVEFGTQNCVDTIEIGLFVFLKSASLLILPTSIYNFIRMPNDTKQILKAAIERGITNRCVIPNEQFESHKKVEKYESFSQINHNLHVDNGRSYLIIGESKNTSLITILQWLIRRQGASNFVIILTDSPTKSNFTYHLNRISKKVSKLIVQVLPYNMKFNIDIASQLITQPRIYGLVEAVFAVSTQQEVVKLMSLVLQKHNSHALLVSLFSGGSEYCEIRRNSGYPAVVIEADDDNIDIIFTLDKLKPFISTCDNNSMPTTLKLFKNECSSGILLSKYLPRNINILKKMYRDMADRLRFKEMNSLSPRYEESKNIYPVFFIPTVHETHLDVVVRKMIYPVFCATVSCATTSVAKMTFELYESLKNIQPIGPVTLVAETWNSILGIELSLLLRRDGRHCKLFLLEGVPNFWITYVKNMKNDIAGFDDHFLKALCINCKILKKSTIGKNKFEDNVMNHLSQFKLSQDERMNILKVISNVCQQLKSLSESQQTDFTLHHTKILVSKISDEYDLKLSVTSEIKEIGGDTYEEFLSNTLLSKTINSGTAFNWWPEIVDN